MKNSRMLLASTFLLAIVLGAFFLVGVTYSGQPYDAWCDLDDDGDIDIFDIVTMAGRYGTTGTPVNKTELLLELQAKVDELESNIAVIQTRIEALNASVQTNDADIAALYTDLAALQTEVDTLEARIAGLEGMFPVTSNNIANGAVTSEKLAAGAIPYGSSYGKDYLSTTSTSWGDIPSMSVSITISRTSHLLIMFSAEASCTTGTGSDFLLVQALVDSTPAYPDQDQGMVLAMCGELWGARSFVFYMPNIGPGTYSVRIQWKMDNGSSAGYVQSRSLSVIALPA